MRGTNRLRELMKNHWIGFDDLYNSKLKEHVTARVEIMRALRAEGYSPSEIGRLLRMNHSTVVYWTTPGRRDKRLSAMKERHHAIEKHARLAKKLARPEATFEEYLTYLRRGFGGKREFLRAARRRVRKEELAV